MNAFFLSRRCAVSYIRPAVRRSGYGRWFAVARMLAITAMLAWPAQMVRADLFWDTTGATAGAGATPTGAWSTTVGNWSSNSGGTVATVNWVQGENAIFAAGTDAANPYTVTLGEAISAGLLTFEEGAATIAAGGFGLTLNTGITVNSTAGAVTISPNLTLAGASQTWANNSSNSLTVAGNISGAGTAINKTGTGTLVLTGNNTFNGLTVSQGTVSANLSAASNSLGSGPITLSGGTLSITPTATTSTQGLSGRVISTPFNVGDTTIVDFTTATGTTLRTDPGLNAVAATNVNQGIQWLGKLQISTAGAYTFYTASDDGSRVWIDGVLVLSNDGGKGTNDLPSSPITLSAGLHDIRVDYVQGQGGTSETLAYSSTTTGADVGATRTVIPAAKLFTAETSTAAGSSNALIVGSGIGNSLNVTSSSTLDLNGGNFTQVQFGNFSLSNGATLSVTGLAGKTLRAGGTFTLPSGGTVGINTIPDVAIDGVVSDGGGNATLTKTGTGRLIFNQTSSANSLASTTTLDIQAGSLVVVGYGGTGGFNPIGNATVRLNGGGMVLDTKYLGGTYNNNINVVQSATIQNIAGAVPSFLGGTINVAGSQTLTLQTISGGLSSAQPATDLGSVTAITGSITGSGNVVIDNVAISNDPTKIITSGLVYLPQSALGGFSGTLTVSNSGVLLATSAAQLPPVITLNNGGSIALYSDGTAAPGTNETISFGSNTITLTGTGGGVIAGRQGNILSPLSFVPPAQNKTVSFGTAISIGTGQTFTISTNNGYAFDLTGAVTVASGGSIGATTTTNSLLLPGATISGQISGSGFTKTGSGTLFLTNSANNFVGDITVAAGQLAVAGENFLGDSGNKIFLTPSTGSTATFRATDNITLTRTLGFGNNTDTRALEVYSGKTLTISNGFDVSATGAATASLAKNDLGTLVLSGSNGSWNGALTINQGVVSTTVSDGLGTSTGNTVIANSGAAFHLSGNQSLAEPFTIAGTGINSQGAIRNVSDINTLSGLITVSAAGSIGADANSTLTLSGGATGAFALTLNAGTNANINWTAGTGGTLTNITKAGAGAATISAALALPAASSLTVTGGSLTVNGSGALGASGTGTVTVLAGGTLSVDDSAGSPVLTRLGGRPVSLQQSTFIYTGNGSSASTEVAGNFTLNGSQSTISLVNGGAGTVLQFGTLTINALSTANVTGTLDANNRIAFSTNPGLTNGIIPRITINGADFATYTGTTTAGSLAAYTGYVSSLNSALTTDNVKLTGSASAPLGRTINSLLLSGSGVSTGITNGVLTISSGGVLSTGGSNTLNGAVTFGATEGTFHVDSSAGLVVNGSVSGTNSVTKAGTGSLTFNAPQYFVGTGSRSLFLSNGTVVLNGGMNTLFPNQFVSVMRGGTLDLNGTSQYINTLDSSSGSTAVGSGGIITSATSSTLVVNQSSNNTFAGSIQGAIYLAKTGNNSLTLNNSGNTYTGATLIQGNSLILNELATLPNTSSIDINFATLSLDNNGGGAASQDLADRIPDAVGITLRGGNITYASRARALSSESLGTVTLTAGGFSTITNTQNTGGIGSATLTIAAINRTSTDTTLNFAGTSLGNMGAASRTFITAAPALTNNIIGGWATVGNDFASYNTVTGVGALSNGGYAGYDGQLLPTSNQPTANIRISGSQTLTGNLTLNSFNILGQSGAVGLSFTNPTDTLNVVSGGFLRSGATNGLIGSVPNEGQLTAGGTQSSGVASLYFTNTGNTAVLNSKVINNGSGAATRLVLNVTSGIVQLAGNNTYTGGTVVNGAAAQLIGTGEVIPAGGITLNNASLTMVTNAGQIAASNAVTLNGGSALTLVGDNALAGITFANFGGTANPTVTTGGILTIPGNALSASSSNVGTTATVAGTLAFSSTPTINVAPITVNSQAIGGNQPTLNISAAISAAPGGLTKSGTGVLQLSGQSTFATGVTLSAGGILVGASSTTTGPTLTSGPLGTGTFNISGGSVITSAAQTLGNAVNVAGNFTVDSTVGTGNSLTLSGAVNVSGTRTMNVVNPNMSVRMLGTVSGTITKSGPGTLVFNNSTGGTYNVTSGAVSILQDGDGTGNPQILPYIDALNFSTNQVVTVDRFVSAIALNKSINATNLSIGGNGLQVVNNNGYGLVAPTAITLTADAAFSVANASVSTAVSGLTLGGAVTGAFGITKQGAGTLELTALSSSFGGAGKNIDIQAGIFAGNNSSAFGAAGTTILLNTNSATQGLRATGNATVAGTVVLNQATNTIEATQGNVLQINAMNIPIASNALVKNDNGVVAINANNSAWSGTITLNGGGIRAMNNNALGTATFTIGNTSSAVQLANNVTVSNPLVVNASNSLGGIQGGGMIQSVSGNNTWAGSITQNTGNAMSMGADSGANLFITGAWTATNSVGFTGAGNVILQSAVPVGSTFQRYDSGTTYLNFASTAMTTTQVLVNAGTIQLGGTVPGGGAQSGAGSLGTGTGQVTVFSGGTLILDDTVAAVTNRMGGTTGHPINLSGGTFIYKGNGTASTENTGQLSFTGAGTVTSNQTGAGTILLNFGSLSSGSDASGVFNGTGLGTAGNKIRFNTAPGLSNNILGRYLFTQGGAFDFVSYDTDGTTANSNGVQAFTAYTAATDINAPATTATVLINAAPATPNLTASKTLNGLKFTGDFTIGGAAQTTLTISSGGIIATNTSATGATINVPIMAFAANDAVMHVNTGSVLNVNSLLTGTGGLVKADGGTMVYAPPSSLISGVTASTINGFLGVNGGTLKFAGGTNTYLPNTFVRVGPNATLDLNGNSQYFQGIFTEVGATALSNGALGTITSATAASLVENLDNTARNWSGQITGAVNFTRSGQNTLSIFSNNTYTGATLVNGATTSLRDGGRLSGTASIDINYANLTLDNSGGNMDLGDRVNDAASVTLRGGTFQLNGRPQWASSETVGTLNVGQGAGTVIAQTGNLNVNSAQLTFASLGTRATASTLNLRGVNGTLGTIGNTPRILFTTAPTLNSMGIIAPWVVANNGDFATYIPGLGVAAVGAAGAPRAYDTTFASGNLTNVTATTNLAANTVTGGIHLSGGGTRDITFSAATTQLNVESGAIIRSDNNNGSSIGTTAARGVLTAGGSASSGTTELLVYNNQNTITINSVITDTSIALGSGTAKVALVKSGASTVALTAANNYSGGTYVSQGTLSLAATTAGTIVIPAGGLTINGATVTQSATVGQIDPSNNVSLNGSATLNLTGNSISQVGTVTSNTLGGLTFDNSGGGTTVPTVNTGAVLNLNGNVTASSSNVTSTSLIAGRIDLGASNRTFTINPITVAGVALAPTQASLALQGVSGTGGIIKEGAGTLQFNVQEVYTGPTTVNTGSVMIGAANAGSRFSTFNLVNSTNRLNLNGLSTTIGALTGTGIVFSSGAAGTLTTGFSDASSTFSGSFSRFTDGTPAGVNLVKVGAGTMTLNSAQSLTTGSTGTLTVNGGGVTYSGAGTGTFATATVASTGTLTLDNAGSDASISGNNVNNRLNFTTATGILAINGGVFNVIGNGAVNSSEAIGTLTIGSGGGIINLTAQPTAQTNVSVGVLSALTTGGSLLLRGSGLGSAAANGVANLSVVTTFNVPSSQGTGTNGTTTMAVRPDIIGDTTLTGVGSAFVTRDSATNVLRPLAAGEMATTFATSATTNFNLIGVANLSAASSANTLVLSSGGGIGLTNSTPAGFNAPDGTPLKLTLTSGGVLAKSGNAGLSAGQFATSNNTAYYFHVVNDVIATPTTLSVGGYLAGTTGGLVKAGDGTLNLNNNAYYTGTTTVNGGALVLNGGNNTLPVIPTATIPTVQPLTVNKGGTFNLNGNSQAVGTLTNNNALPNTGGIVTNTAGGGAVNFTSVTGAASTFAGNINGNLNFVKYGNNALTLTGANGYTGSTVIGTSSLVLRDGGALTGTTSVTLNHGTTLQLDNTGLNSTILPPNRIGQTVPITLNSATLRMDPASSTDTSVSFDSVTAGSGHSTINVPQAPVGTTGVLNIGNLVHTNPDATINFTGGNSSNFFSGTPGFNNSQVFVGSINGTTTRSTITSKILGGWAVVNNGEFATYITSAEAGTNGLNYGIVTMNGPAGIAADLYDSSATTFPASSATSNVRVTATAAIPTGGATYNVVAMRTGTTNITFAAAGDVLNLASGGLALTAGTHLVGTAALPGVLTSGGTAASGTQPLYIYSNVGTINSVIANSGVGTATTRLVLVPTGGVTTIAGNNTYTGGTVINGSGGTVTLSSTTTAIPAGGLTLNNVAVTSSVAGNINASNAVTLNGGASLTFTGSNTIASLSFNNTGGAANPTVATATSLTLSAANAITAVNNNFGFTPTISGTAISLSNASPTVNVSGNSTVNLIVSAPLTSTTGAITKLGSGAMVLSGATAHPLANGLKIEDGSVIFDNTAATNPYGTATITLGNLANNTKATILSGTAARTISNPITVANDFTFGGATAVNNLTLGGIVSLGANNPRSITVSNALGTGTISGQITGTGTSGITKAGPGTLVLSNATNNYTGPTNIAGGILQAGIVNALPSTTDVSISAGGALNINAFNQTIGSLSGAGMVTNSGALATLSVGSTNGTSSFGGLVTAATAANLVLTKIGTGTFSLTNPNNNYAGGTNVNGGTLLLPGAGISAYGTGVLNVNNFGTLSGVGLINGGLAINPGSTLALGFGATTPISTGAAGLAVNGPGTFNLAGIAGAGTYTLIDYAGTALTNAQFGGLKIGTTPGGAFVYSLVNNTSNTSVDLLVEAANGTTATWTGGASGIWDTTTSGNFSTGTFSNGLQVLFNDSGANKTISGTAVAPQGMTVNNSVGNNYTIANNITGSVANGLTKTGTGTLTLTGANTIAGPITVSGGTLKANVSSTASALGTGTIALSSNTTLDLNAAPSLATNGLTGRSYNTAATGNIIASKDLTAAADDVRNYFTTGTTGLNTSLGTGGVFYTGGPTINFVSQWGGKLSIPASGMYSFFLNSDDGSRLYIDGTLVTNNDGSHGGNETGGTSLLAAGLHDIRMEYSQGTGGLGVILSWNGPGLTKAQIPSSNIFTAENVSSTAISNQVNLGNVVSVSGTPTINLSNTNSLGAQVAGLSISSGSTLNVTGVGSSQFRSVFTSFTGGGTDTINAGVDVYAGQILDNGVAVTIAKTGAGRIFFNNSSNAGGLGSSMLAASLIDVQQGKAVLMGGGPATATNPIGAAGLRLSGGGLVLDTKGGNVTYDNAIAVTQNATIEHIAAGATITLGSASNGISIASGKTLTLDLMGGTRGAGNAWNIGTQAVPTLTIPGNISGAGNLVVQSTQLNNEAFPVNGILNLSGTLSYTGSTTLIGQPQFPGAGSPLTVNLSGTATLASTSTFASPVNLINARIDVNNSATGQTTTDRLPNATAITLNNSTLSFTGATAAASSETYGALTLGTGLNQVIMTNAGGAANATTFTGASLNRGANRSTVMFTATTLGGAALNADNVLFTTSPAGSLVGGGGAAASKNISILPYAVGRSGTAIQVPVTYDANGIRPLSTTTEMSALTVAAGVATYAGAAGDNAFLSYSSATSYTAGSAFNSLVVQQTANSSQTLALTGTQTISSGVLVMHASGGTGGVNTITGGQIAFGSAEGQIFSGTNANVISSQISGTSGLTISGLGQFTLNADNSALLTGTITINGTQVVVNDDTNLGAATNPITLAGGILKFGTAGKTLASTRTITIPANSFGSFDVGANSGTVASQVTGAGTLMVTAGVGSANSVTLTNASNNFTGPIFIQSGNLITNYLPAVNVANHGTLTLNLPADQGYSNLISGVGGVTLNSAVNFTFNSPQTYGGTTLINAGTVTFGVAQALPLGNNVTVGGSSTAATLDNGSFNNVIGSLNAGTNSTTNADTIIIPAGNTLTVVGNMTLGANGSATATTLVNFKSVGAATGGNLVVSRPGGIVQVGGATAGNYSNTTADMTSLTSFTANLGAAGALRVGDTNTGGGSAGNGISTFNLAPTSTVTAGTIGIGDTEASNENQTLSLGTGVTTFNTDSLVLGAGASPARSNGILNFQSASGSLMLRGSDGTSRSNITIVGTSSGTGSTINGTMTLTGHTSDLLVNTLNMATRSGGNAGNGNAVATLTFDSGTLDVTTAILSYKSGTTTYNGTSSATLNIAGGTATFGSIQMAGTSATGTGTAGLSAATLNLTGGTTTVNGAITKIGFVSPAVDGPTSAAIILNGATAVLDMTNHAIGGVNAIDSLTFAAGTLKNVSEINAGTTALTKTTAGTLFLDGVNTYSGNTAITNGTLKPVTLASLPSGSGKGNIILDGGASVAGTLDINGLNLNINGLSGVSGAVPGQVLNSVAGNKTLTVGNNNATASFAGTILDNSGIGGTVALAKVGTGSQTLSGANTYTGGTTLSAGTLIAANSTGSALGTGDLTLNGGTFASGVVGSITGNVVAGSGAHIIAPGGVGSIGALTVGGLTLSANSTLNFDITNNTTLDALTTGALAAGGLVNIQVPTGLAVNTYKLIGFGSTALSNTSNFTLNGGSIPAGYSLSLAGNELDLVVAATGPINLTWGGGTGGWSSGGSGWLNAGNPANWSDANNAIIGSGTDTAGTITVSGTVKPTTMTFNAASTGNYTVTGGTIDMNGTTMTVTANTAATINSTLANGSLTKAGTSSLTLTGTHTYSGATNVSAGTLQVGTPTTAGSIAASSGVTVASSASFVAGSTTTVKSLNLSASNANASILAGALRILTVGDGTSDTGLLDLSGSGSKLDLNSGAVVLNFNSAGVGTSLRDTIKGLIGTGKIMSSRAVAANLADPNTPVGIGYALGDYTAVGLPSDATSIVARYTLVGDANLDGVVDVGDLGTALAPNYGSPSGNYWQSGDFNGDGAVDTSDLALLAANYGKTLTLPGDAVGNLNLNFEQDLAQAFASVPEPGTLSVLGLAALALLKRRNHGGRKAA